MSMVGMVMVMARGFGDGIVLTTCELSAEKTVLLQQHCLKRFLYVLA